MRRARNCLRRSDFAAVAASACLLAAALLSSACSRVPSDAPPALPEAAEAPSDPVETPPPGVAFADGVTVDLGDIERRGLWFSFDGLVGHEAPDRTAPSFELPGGYACFFLEDEASDWIRAVGPELEYGAWVNVRDFDDADFYGDLEERAASGNYFWSLLSREHALTRPGSPYRRYGPLLLVERDGGEVRIWDHFGGEAGSRYYLLLSELEDGLLELHEQHYEGGLTVLFDPDRGRAVAEARNPPVFSPDRSRFFTYGEIYGESLVFEVFKREADGHFRTLLSTTIDPMTGSGRFWELKLAWDGNETVQADFGEDRVVALSAENGWDLQAAIAGLPEQP
ncbi:MAG: hypothetical protein JXA15_02000 [Spirochaetales bacterium]|nr:hypothetical protein [Spirochaetales bacterium]